MVSEEKEPKNLSPKMAPGGFAPKCRILTSNETQSSLDTWRETVLFNLTLDGTFECILEEDNLKWGPSTETNRGLKPDATSKADGKTGKQKAAVLKLLLGTIASYAPVISRQFIMEEAKSLDDIWSRLRIFYGFRKSGALVLDLPTISLEEGESYEALWERYHAFLMDSLIRPADGLSHMGTAAKDVQTEVMSPTLMNVAVVLWLRSIHPALPALIKQKFTTELRNRTLITLREEISESLESMLAELNGETAAIARSSYQRGFQKKGFNRSSNSKQPFYQKTTRSCPLCQASDRQSDHFLSECPFLPEADRRFMSSRARSRAVEADEFEDQAEWEEGPADIVKNSFNRRTVIQQLYQQKVKTDALAGSVDVRKVGIMSSPYLTMNYGGHGVPLLLDSGAEANLIELEFAESLKLPLSKTTASASQADGASDLKIVGEVHVKLSRGSKQYQFDALVANKLTDKVIAGVPFLDLHDIYPRPSKRTIYIGKEEVPYDAQNRTTNAQTRTVIMRVPRRTVLMPGESLSLAVPDEFSGEKELAVEPRPNAKSFQHEKYNNMWLQPQITEPTEGVLNLVNKSRDPVLLGRHEQVATIRPVTAMPEHAVEVPPSVQPSKARPVSVKSEHVSPTHPVQVPESMDYKDVNIDPDGILTPAQRKSFADLHHKYKDVFDSRTLGCYNGKSGPFDVTINMGPTLPPQRKGKMPLYSRSQMEEMQQICDELEGTVLLKPEEVGVTVEYLNPSFLVRKKSGKKRLVTAFGEVGKYAKPQPSLMPNINSTLRHMANWKYIINSDMRSAYWQMLLNKLSMRYCGIATPYKGIRVYGRGAMGMPGTETALEELMSRILGDLIAAGGVVKVSDDVYCGGATPEEALEQWSKVLAALNENGLRLSASKTVICPVSVVILGWLWKNGTISATQHKVSALTAVEPPVTVGKMRSYIGSFKFLSRVMPQYSDLMQPLEESVAGRKKSDKVQWTESLYAAFRRSQEHLLKAKVLTVPRREDQLQIVTDASQAGIAAALYVIRDGKPKIAGHFNAQLKKHHASWLPCETEALAISAAVTHFAPEIVNSNHQTTVLSDSLPCVQAYAKLCRGEFSASSRVATFLITLSRFNVHLGHLKGSNNIYSDYASRNPVTCDLGSCQVCSFVADTSESVIRACSVKDVLESSMPVPFCSRSGWQELQVSDDSLRRTCAHLRQGTKPSKKDTKIRDVKRYLQVARISNDGLIVTEQHVPGVGKREKIIIPRQYLGGLLECLHLKLEHPTKSQLRQVFCRAYYALDLEGALDLVTRSCHTCVALSDMPNNFLQQTMTTHPSSVGSNFSADVVRRSGQHILLIREYISSFTQAKLIPNEQAATLRTALQVLCSNLIPVTGSKSTVKVDPASSCRSLVKDRELGSSGISVELGWEKFKNKNPVAERAIRELHSELNRVLEGSKLISEKDLARAVANMNCRIRGEGVSAREIWYQRDQYSGSQIPIDDLMLIKAKEEQKKSAHKSSATFKARGKKEAVYPAISKGDLIYVNSDRDKTHPRDRYVVTEVLTHTCKVQKFSGMQLRARSYTVNRADILKVQPWLFTDASSESDDESEDEHTNYQHAASEDVAEDVAEEDESDEGEEDVMGSGDDMDESHDISLRHPPEVTTRSGRKSRLPTRFADFQMGKKE